MTSAIAPALATTEPADVKAKDGAECARQLPLHNAPSMHDMLALKRQRRSLDEVSVGSQQNSELPSEQQQASPDRATCSVTEPDAVQTHSPQSSTITTSSSFALPVLPAVPGESMAGYFTRLRDTFSQHQAQAPRVTTSLELDGIYVRKRPIRAPNGSSPLAVCGSVLHHVVVYVKQGELLHTLDYGPANGADVTANILEEVPAKKVLTTGPVTEEPLSSATAATGANVAAPVGGSDGTAGTLPLPGVAVTQEELQYMYLGPATYDVEHPLVRQLIAFAESRPYHALRNNCIHFADVLVRVMTGTAVRGVTLLYDITCGSVPVVDNPMLLMMQLMLRMSWFYLDRFVVVDGSPLAAAFQEHCRAISRPDHPQPQAPPPAEQIDPRVAVAADSVKEDQGDNITAAATAAPGLGSAGMDAAVKQIATQGVQDAAGFRVGDERSRELLQQQVAGTRAALGLLGAEEPLQERENVHALCEVEEPESSSANLKGIPRNSYRSASSGRNREAGTKLDVFLAL
ncbi:hypothetical protein VOLCADRAFT_87327 [Volvox carteri f. nagariensis]|uniref:PPPDE domain-containing protein n=1 Tax=Volvox carteri f. nagariensis TaxID=3068 RepID=D8TL20_VOLCA|nr:uncharacterized protein VOLCADRAFT_87327 [Volvox carteri f. nagariensis]EFJ51796.1 hypothetical protein VOLCADRAFT_87327 [Volvox carteri f. nagariensis]|eukprot:XP_002947206.1 hypothetical protein VOLCADRAFT_87327 [Volvox carteri f. nagariensis]